MTNTRGFGGRSEAARLAALSRLSSRATEWLEVHQHDSMAACADALRAEGCELLVATTPQTDGAVPLYGGGGGAWAGAGAGGGGGGGVGGGGGGDGDCGTGGAWARRRVALLFGSEGSGLSAEALALADVRLSVPQSGMTQSLNVAACATLVLGEALRLRGVAAAEKGTLTPGMLSEEEQGAAAARLLEHGAAPRRHNKASTKAAMQGDL